MTWSEWTKPKTKTTHCTSPRNTWLTSHISLWDWKSDVVDFFFFFLKYIWQWQHERLRYMYLWINGLFLSAFLFLPEKQKWFITDRSISLAERKKCCWLWSAISSLLLLFSQQQTTTTTTTIILLAILSGASKQQLYTFNILQN